MLSLPEVRLGVSISPLRGLAQTCLQTQRRGAPCKGGTGLLVGFCSMIMKSITSENGVRIPVNPTCRCLPLRPLGVGGPWLGAAIRLFCIQAARSAGSIEYARDLQITGWVPGDTVGHKKTPPRPPKTRKPRPAPPGIRALQP